MSNLEDLLKKLKIDIDQNQQHYVYYDTDSKNIHKISPKQENTSYEVFAIDSKTVDPILKGIGRLNDYFVYFDYGLKKFNIRQKSFDNFNKTNLIEVTTSNTPDVLITITSDSLLFKTDDSLVEHLENDQSNLLFIITEKNNPYALYSTVSFPAYALLENAIAEHQLSTQQLKKGVSIYTNPVFGSYSIEVTYDN
jgi:hypothetical protein